MSNCIYHVPVCDVTYKVMYEKVVAEFNAVNSLSLYIHMLVSPASIRYTTHCNSPKTGSMAMNSYWLWVIHRSILLYIVL